jgi:hypothetical protein
MSQADIGNISAGQTGPDFFDNKLEPWRNALHSGHSGTSRPSYVLAGMTWIDTTTNPWIEKLFDGTDDITKGTIDITTNTYTSAGSGAPYTAPTTTVGASITLAEGTTNGTNTAKIKAGDSLGSDITATVVTGGNILTVTTGTITSSNLRGMLTDETGAGLAMFNEGPAFAAGTTSVAAYTLTSGTNLTTATAGSVEYDGKVIYATPQSTQRGIVPAEQFFRLDAALAGANGTSAQNALGVSFGVSASTVYEFEAVINLSKSAGTTSHNLSWLFGLGGGASLNNISYQVTGDISVVSFTSGFGSRFTAAPQVATAVAAYTGLTSASLFIVLNIKGTVSVNAAGTLTPQYILSAAPGGAYTTAQGSFFKIKPIGASGANVSVGNIS